MPVCSKKEKERKKEKKKKQIAGRYLYGSQRLMFYCIRHLLRVKSEWIKWGWWD
jgi:hypothetical protein